MLVATWNINGIKARIDSLLRWLGELQPDVVCLQEIKSVDETFPCAPIEALGYNVATHGQKGFNGVAILSKLPLESVSRGLPGDAADAQSRFITADVSIPGAALRIACAYMPNGNPIGTEKFAFKIDWHRRLEAWARDQLLLEQPLVLCGDFNIIPEPIDAKFADNWRIDALYQPESRAAFRSLCALGLTDSVRAVEDGGGHYTFWDYQAGAWQRNNGIRIDHLLLSPEAADRLVQAGIDRHTRAWEKPSDHVPVWIELR